MLIFILETINQKPAELIIVRNFACFTIFHSWLNVYMKSGTVERYNLGHWTFRSKVLTRGKKDLEFTQAEIDGIDIDETD